MLEIQLYDIVVFKKKATIKAIFMLCCNQPAFTFNFELGLPYVLCIVLNVFRLDVINLGNIQASFKDSPNVNMKFFPGALPLHQRLPGLQLPFNFGFAKNNMLKLSPGYATVTKSTVQICQLDPLKVTALKCSTKE